VEQNPQTTDLTSPDAIAKSQEIYDRMVAGQVQDVTAALHTAHGTGQQQN